MTTITIERSLIEQSIESFVGYCREMRLMIGDEESEPCDAEKALRAALAAPATFDIDVETLIEIVTDIRQYINHGVASEKFEALQRPGYGTGIYTHISNQLDKIMAILADPATAPDRHAQELLAQDITLQNMTERHAQEICAYSVTVGKLRDQAASAPAWHDAPTCDGLWVCNEGDDSPYRWTTHLVKFPISPLLVGEDERWYGPIPEDKKAAGRLLDGREWNRSPT